MYPVLSYQDAIVPILPITSVLLLAILVCIALPIHIAALAIIPFTKPTTGLSLFLIAFANFCVPSTDPPGLSILKRTELILGFSFACASVLASVSVPGDPQ